MRSISVITEEKDEKCDDSLARVDSKGSCGYTENVGEQLAREHNDLLGIQGGTPNEHYHIIKRLYDALQVESASGNNKFLTVDDVPESAVVSYGFVDHTSFPLVINWLTSIVPGDTRTYYQKHGDIKAMVIQTAVMDPLFNDPDILTPITAWRINVGDIPQLVIDNQQQDLYYTIQGKGIENIIPPEKLDQAIIFNPIPNLVLGSGPYHIDVYATSGLPVTLESFNTAIVQVDSNGNNLIPIAIGTTSIRATQLGNDVYNPATAVIRGVTVINTDSTNWIDEDNWDDNYIWIE